MKIAILAIIVSYLSISPAYGLVVPTNTAGPTATVTFTHVPSHTPYIGVMNFDSTPSHTPTGKITATKTSTKTRTVSSSTATALAAKTATPTKTRTSVPTQTFTPMPTINVFNLPINIKVISIRQAQANIQIRPRD